MNNFIRITSAAGVLTMALAGTAGAATLRLEPLTKQTVATSVNTCAVPSVPAAITQAEPADIPAIAEGQHATGITTVRIELNPEGQLTAQHVMDSSGNPWLDGAALIAARFSKYSAEVRDCRSVGGAYALVVDFTQ